MKKYLFLAISILSIFFVTDRVDALSFTTPNGNSYEVVDEETFASYCYFINQNENFVVVKASFSVYTDAYMCLYHNIDSDKVYVSNNTLYSKFGYYRDVFSSDFVNILKENQFISNSINYSFEFIYSSFDIYDSYEKTNLSFSKNITTDYLINKYDLAKKNIYTITYYLNDEIYQTIEVEEGSSHDLLTYDYNENTHNFSGWTYDESIDLTNITSDIVIKATLEQKEVIPVYLEFPITKTEFYALLVEVGVLIMIIFLKWCFPFKGGSDLR